MTRREQREHIFKLLFFVEFYEKSELNEQQQFYFDELGEIQEKDSNYILEKYKNIGDRLSEIDELLETVSKGWKTERMGKVELAILRLAVYEMKFDDDIPVGVAINEAIELAKKYGGDNASAFINGILAKLV